MDWERANNAQGNNIAVNSEPMSSSSSRFRDLDDLHNSSNSDSRSSSRPSMPLTITEDNKEDMHPLARTKSRKPFMETNGQWAMESNSPHGHGHNGDLPPVEAKIVPLKKTEVWAWYFQNATYCAYGWISAAVMVPLLIQDIAASGGVQVSNHAIPCDTSVADYNCVKQIFGHHYLDPGTISLYISSFSAVVSFIVSLSIAAVADHGSYRKSLLVVFAILGCLVSLGYFFVRSGSMFWLTVVLSPLGWAFYNISSVFSNAFLPIYVRVHPKVLEAGERVEAHRTLQEMDEVNRSFIHNPAGGELIGEDRDSTSSSSGVDDILETTIPTESSVFSVAELRKVEEQVSNDLSAWCAGAANVGAMIVQVACIGISHWMHDPLLSLQVAIAFTGVWWLGGTIVAMPWLDARPGPPMSKGRNWIAYSWEKNYTTFKSMRKLSQVTKFIFAWFILSDGVNTVTALFCVITYQDLHFSHTKSLVMTVVLSVLAFIGAYLFLYIRHYWSLSTKFMIMLTLVLYGILTAYFVVPSYFTTRFGLRQEWEAWASVACLGLIISTFYGVARVMMAELCPEGDENEWFSLFQLADKGSSWIGPFVTGAIQQATGEFRTGFWFPLGLFVLGGALLLTVDMNKGKDEAIVYKQNQKTKDQLMSSIPPITITPAGDNNRQSSPKTLAWL